MNKMLQKVLIGTSLSVLYSYFDPTELFSDLYLAKVLDTPTSKNLLSVGLPSLIGRLSVNYD